MYKTATGVDICGYENIDDWKKVLVVDLEVGTLQRKLKSEQEKTADLIQLRDLQAHQIDAMAESQHILKDHSDKLTDQLIELDAKYQKERVKSRIGSPVAWTIAAVSTAVLVGFVASAALR